MPSYCITAGVDDTQTLALRLEAWRDSFLIDYPTLLARLLETTRPLVYGDIDANTDLNINIGEEAFLHLREVVEAAIGSPCVQTPDDNGCLDHYGAVVNGTIATFATADISTFLGIPQNYNPDGTDDILLVNENQQTGKRYFDCAEGVIRNITQNTLLQIPLERWFALRIVVINLNSACHFNNILAPIPTGCRGTYVTAARMYATNLTAIDDLEGAAIANQLATLFGQSADSTHPLYIPATATVDGQIARAGTV